MTSAPARLPLLDAYRAGHLSDFFARTPADLPAFLQAQRVLDRPALAAALRAYHLDVGLPDGTAKKADPAAKMLAAQLEKLSHPEARVVVAGQQAGLLGGPAYSVHKAADAILLARQLSTEERPVLPVFWIASQDHDADEVASTHLLDFSEREFEPRLDLPRGVPVGRIAWRAEWSAQLLELISEFDAPETHKAAVRSRLDFAFKGRAYADVFARLMYTLLGEHGLIVLDPLHPALARLMAPALAAEIDRPLEGPQRIEAAAEQLGAQGYTAQLRRPPGSTNLFVEEESGQRTLLRVSQQGGKTFEGYTKAELLSLLDSDPSRITPAAGLRPIIQDYLLPTAAFVVGPGELAYAAELRGVYELHGLEQPVLWPRLSVTWLEPNVARLLERFGVTAAQFQQGPEGTLGKALASQQQAAALSQERINHLEGEFSALMNELSALDPTLKSSVERSKNRTMSRLERHRQQAYSALSRAEDDKSGQLTRLKKHLLPAGHLQEREMNFLTYLLKHGDAPLKLLLSLEAGAQVDVVIP
ncbi:bacillithiol biosynthesis cysteine-adding enzyme BshC [Deinococcus psychrotolerans]|uniref:Putative cysteine ligase BshC n=1 Tax=Deinococcus psychrotolerans TaxID=2489213 RepID=A0A3G8YFM8_9DEIO|nr:bacillithiol biosynthesis cysteine-adding enzyme BshC [Deinococcus psychrotolerans]AZI41334.1 bacillithiol biosynthesis cysteine-adding enzyme BshC [Deinococcus psychrotolerans]